MFRWVREYAPSRYNLTKDRGAKAQPKFQPLRSQTRLKTKMPGMIPGLSLGEPLGHCPLPPWWDSELWVLGENFGASEPTSLKAGTVANVQIGGEEDAIPRLDSNVGSQERGLKDD